MARRPAQEEEYDDEEEFLEEEVVPQEDKMTEVLRATPWWLISIVAHFILVLIFMTIVYALPPDKVELRVVSEIEEIEEDVYDPEKERDIEKINEVREPKEDPTEDPQIEKEAVDDHNETDNNEITEEFKAENPSDFHADNPFEAQGFNTSMGVGGNVGGGGAFGGRKGGNKEKRARGGGGGKDTESAVTAGLEWLKRHQDTSGPTMGVWDSDNWQQHCDAAAAKDPRFHTNHPDCKKGQGWQVVDSGLTGLSLLAFLGAGHTSKDGDYKKTVRDGLQYLIQTQQANGCFASVKEVSDHHYPYSHAICVMAMAEAYGMTGSRVFEEPAQRGIQFIASMQNEYLAWRYGTPDFKPKDNDNDSSVTGWVILACKSARLAELVVPDIIFDGGKKFINMMTDPAYGKVGYKDKGGGGARLEGSKAAPNEAITGVGILSRLYTGDKREHTELKAGATLLLKDLPVWDVAGGKVDFYYWYYGSLAMFQMGEKYWERWNQSMKDALLPNQHRITDGDLDGSWPPMDDAWGMAGGRVYATAINVLTLEVYYRYDFLGSNKQH